MANHLSITASVLVVLFSISYARFTADLPGGVTLTDEPETVNSIFLPSEKPQPESEPDVNKLNLPADGVQPDENRQDPPSLPAETSGETESEPLTVITFRPINRHSPRHPLMPLRNGHRCRHMFRRGSSGGGGGGPLLKRWGSRFNGPKDVIISSARRDAGDETPPSTGPSTGGARDIPMRWASAFHTRRPRLPTWRNDVGWTNNNEEMVKAIKDKHQDLHRHVEIEERKKEQEHEQQDQNQNQKPELKVDNGFVKKIRKFLDHF